MDWFEYIRQNIWVGIIIASILTSVIVAFINLNKKAQDVDNTVLNVVCALVIGGAVTNFNLDWNLFTSYQDTAIRLTLTVLIPYLVAKVRGQEIVDSVIAKVVDGAKNISIGNKQ